LATLSVRVTPRSNGNRLEVVDGKVKVWVTAAPVDGAANEAVRQLLAKAVQVAPSRVQIVRGHNGREKELAFEGVSDEELMQRLTR